MHVETRGGGVATLVLLHGMGATGAVWRRVIRELDSVWGGRIGVCALPRHGASSGLERYSYDTVASAVAGCLPASARLVVAGHSFGAMIAVHLASAGHAVAPAAVVATGVKVRWTADELATMATLAAK